MSMLLPTSLGSPGAILSARSENEAEYAAAAQPEVERFLHEVSEFAVAGQLTLAAVLGLWAAAIDRVRDKVPVGSQILAAMAEHPLPSIVFMAASAQVAQSAQLALSAAESLARLQTALGLAKDPIKGMGGAYGRILGGDGSTLTWTKQTEALARTSSTADFGQAMIDQMRAEGYTHKRWMTRYDSRVRESHGAVDRKTIPLEDSFLVGGYALRYPADPMCLNLSEVINCRCVLVAVRFGRHELDHPEGTEPWNNPRP